MALEALRFHIEGTVADGEPIPAPSFLDEIMTDADHHDGIAVLIDMAVHRPAIRVNFPLPADLVEAIDPVSDNRSRFLAEAAREKLEAQSGFCRDDVRRSAHAVQPAVRHDDR